MDLPPSLVELMAQKIHLLADSRAPTAHSPKTKHAIAGPPYRDKTEGGGTAMMPAASTPSNHRIEMMIVMNAANFRNLLDDKSLLF